MLDTPPNPIPVANSITQSIVPEVIMASGYGHQAVAEKISQERTMVKSPVAETYGVFLIDDHFDSDAKASQLGAEDRDLVISVSTSVEPTDMAVDGLVRVANAHSEFPPFAVVGFGGGITMDSAKALSNLLANGGSAAEYQGWDLLRVPGIRKIGVPTIAGTGAESSRTCVISNARTGAKLGMNSKYSLFDSIVLDPEFSSSVPRAQFFYTGMDTYMHCVESLNGRFRNAFADALSRESLRLLREVFSSSDMMSFAQRSNLTIASCLGGMAIAGSYVGLIHPMSAALGIVLGTHHGIGNCIVMRAMQEFYPAEYDEFWAFADRHQIDVPTIDGGCLSQVQLDQLVASTLLHSRPLSNALGVEYERVLSPVRLQELFAML